MAWSRRCCHCCAQWRLMLLPASAWCLEVLHTTAPALSAPGSSRLAHGPATKHDPTAAVEHALVKVILDGSCCYRCCCVILQQQVCMRHPAAMCSPAWGTAA
jgi:hypothetical protein